MPFFTSPAAAGTGPVRIAFDDEGEGKPIVLVHGFASNRSINWKGPGWYATLRQAGRRVIALDCRGHGESDKPHERAAYDEGLMARDVTLLMDHVGVRTADLMGYSMGGFIAMRLLKDAPARFPRVVLGGLGENYLSPVAAIPEQVAAALLADDVATITDKTARQFRLFADSSGNDRKALAACMMRPRVSFGAADYRDLKTPVLVIVGEKDAITGRPEPLAALLPNATAEIIPGRDHMVAVGDRIYKEKALAFLAA